MTAQVSIERLGVLSRFVPGPRSTKGYAFRMDLIGHLPKKGHNFRTIQTKPHDPHH